MREERGTIFVEYLLLLAFFAIPVAYLTLQLGPLLLRLHRYTELVLSGPVP